MKHLTFTFLLGAAFLALTGSLTAGNAIVAAASGAACAWLAAGGPSRWRLRHVVAAPWLVLGTALELLRGSWRMLRVLVGRDSWRRVGTVEVPAGARSDGGIALSGLIATATPGSVLIDVDERRRVMIVNVIDASDPQATRAELDAFYRRFQRRVAP